MAGALRVDDLALTLNLIALHRGHRRRRCSPGARGAERGRPRRVLRAAAQLGRPAWSLLAAANNTVVLFLGLELLSIPLYVLCATEMRREHVARVRAEVPDHRLGRLGHAALRPGAALRRHRGRPASATSSASITVHGLASDPLLLTGIAPVCRRARVQGVAWRPSTSGPPTSTRAPRRRSPRSWRWPRRRPRSAPSCGCFDVALINAVRLVATGDRGRSPPSRSSSATSARSGSPR